MPKEKIDNPRVQGPVFAEPDMWEMARLLSKRYTKMGKPVCGKRDGSASWYFRNAALERMQKDGVKIDQLRLSNYQIYPSRR